MGYKAITFMKRTRVDKVHILPHIRKNPNSLLFTGPDSLVVRASASGAVGRGFAPRSRHTKGVENGTSSSLADVRIKSARKIE